VKAFWHKQ
jgi:hypothetical protein